VATDHPTPIPLSLEEKLNALTHAIGGVLSLVVAIPLVRPILGTGRLLELVSVIVYCVSLSAVYFASTLSHWVVTPIWRRVFRAWDQGLIYILIVATYTPLAVIHLEGAWHLLTIFMWLVAIAGFLSKIAIAYQVDGIALWLYLILGWMPALALPALIASAPLRVVFMILVGGLAYSGGAVLLAHDHRANFMHTGWHLFVILGSWCHYVAIYWSVQ
jgi:hemolysin III